MLLNFNTGNYYTFSSYKIRLQPYISVSTVVLDYYVLFKFTLLLSSTCNCMINISFRLKCSKLMHSLQYSNIVIGNAIF